MAEGDDRGVAVEVGAEVGDGLGVLVTVDTVVAVGSGVCVGVRVATVMAVGEGVCVGNSAKAVLTPDSMARRTSSMVISGVGVDGCLTGVLS